MKHIRQVAAATIIAGVIATGSVEAAKLTKVNTNSQKKMTKEFHQRQFEHKIKGAKNNTPYRSFS